MTAIYGLFADPATAHRGFESLQKASSDLGFDRGAIVVSSSEPIEGYHFGEKKPKVSMFLLAALGGVAGGTFGYWLTSFTQRAYVLPTGGMPIVPPWTNGIIVYELTMLGAILVTLVTLLRTTRLPTFKAPLSDPEIWSGKILVGVRNVSGQAKAELEKRLRQAGASEVKQSS